MTSIGHDHIKLWCNGWLHLIQQGLAHNNRLKWDVSLNLQFIATLEPRIHTDSIATDAWICLSIHETKWLACFCHVFLLPSIRSGIDLAGQTLSNTFTEVPMGWIWMITLIKSHSLVTAPTLTLQWGQAAWQPMVNYTTPDRVCLSLKGLFHSLCLALVRWCG